MLVSTIGNIVQFTICFLALWRGGRDERIVAAALLANTLASKLAVSSDWVEPEYLVLVADMALLTVLVTLALRTTRWWVLWCAAFELLIVITHVAIVVDPTVRARSYVTGMIIWSYMVLLPLGFGAWETWRGAGRRQAPS
ncbi:hypothetical protein ACFODL_19105 [Phenylobacterium terrae]|uniref:Uncharacterized protein n=1 Tax=Phenylobacterium terrae TaxID=2665495 RepID=A0ABW4N0X6_9CAUL